MFKYLKKKFQSLKVSQPEEKKPISAPLSQKLIDIKDDVFSEKLK